MLQARRWELTRKAGVRRDEGAIPVAMLVDQPVKWAKLAGRPVPPPGTRGLKSKRGRVLSTVPYMVGGPGANEQPPPPVLREAAPPGLMYASVPLISESDRDVYYLAGPGGVGKSTYIASLCRMYARMRPRSRIFLLSKKSHDDVIDSLTEAEGKPTRLDWHRFWADIPPLTDFQDTMFIMDDCDTLPTEQFERLLFLLKELINDGRQVEGKPNSACTVVWVTHQSTDGNRSRAILSGITKAVVWPVKTNKNQMRCLLGTLGCEERMREICAKSYGSKWGWVTIEKSEPLVVLTPYEAELWAPDWMTNPPGTAGAPSGATAKKKRGPRQPSSESVQARDRLHAEGRRPRRRPSTDNFDDN